MRPLQSTVRGRGTGNIRRTHAFWTAIKHKWSAADQARGGCASARGCCSSCDAAGCAAATAALNFDI